MAWLLAILLACTGADKSVAPSEGLVWAKRVAETYRNLPYYDLRGTQVLRVGAPGEQTPPIESALRVAGIRPDRSLNRNDMPMLGMHAVTRGDSTWTYAPNPNVWWVTPAMVNFQQPSPAMNVEDLAQLDQSEVTYGGRETLQSKSGAVECVRLCLSHTMGDSANSFSSIDTLWVDATRNLVVRQVAINTIQPMNTRMDLVVTWDQIELKTPPADSLFTFVPPAGARRIEVGARVKSTAPDAPSAGKAAPAFSLPDVAGGKVTLADLKGRVVLIDFWATWCGPCRVELPHVQKLHDEFGKKGLTVLAITSETRERAVPFLKENGYTFRCLVDGGSVVARDYGVTAIPVAVVVGRDGVVVEQLVGLQSEASLRAALKKAGL